MALDTAEPDDDTTQVAEVLRRLWASRVGEDGKGCRGSTLGITGDAVHCWIRAAWVRDGDGNEDEDEDKDSKQRLTSHDTTHND